MIRITNSRILIIILYISMFCTVWIGYRQTQAESVQTDVLENALLLEWHPLSGQDVQGRDGSSEHIQNFMASLLEKWNKLDINGHQLPIHTFIFPYTNDEEILLDIKHLESIPWQSELVLTEYPKMRSEDGTELPRVPKETDFVLPDSPLFVLREGEQRGERFIVIAVSPIFAQGESVQVATSMQATLPNFVLDTTQSRPTVPKFLSITTPKSRSDSIGATLPNSPLATPTEVPGSNRTQIHLAIANQSPLASPTATLVQEQQTSPLPAPEATSTPEPTHTAIPPEAAPNESSPIENSADAAPQEPTEVPTIVSVTQVADPTENNYQLWLMLGFLGILGLGIFVLLMRQSNGF